MVSETTRFTNDGRMTDPGATLALLDYVSKIKYSFRCKRSLLIPCHLYVKYGTYRVEIYGKSPALDLGRPQSG